MGSALALMGLIALLAWLWMPDDATPTSRPPAAPAPPLVQVSPTDVPLPPSVDLPSAGPPIASRVPVGVVDPCGDAEDDPPVVRPSTTELLQLRVAELNDRMVANFRSTHASRELREGWHAAQDPTREDEALRMLASAPDRLDDGFDSYVSVAVVLAANALHQGDALRAIRLSELASRAAPNDPLPLVIGAVAHAARHDHAAARDQLARAFALDPEEPAVALRLAMDLENGPDVHAALRAFDAYLAAVPDDREMARRRARVGVRGVTFAHGVSFERGTIHLLAPAGFSRETATHVLDVVEAGLRRGALLLGVPRREELTVFVHPDGDAMRRATCTQAWTGAVFDGALETDAQTIAMGARGDTMLAHECFHASIHPAVPDVPTWLDEGLAEYASGEERPSLRRSYELMVREHTWVPFATMDDAFLVIDDGADAGLAYDQALAMVEWLVARRGERGIRDAAAWLIAGGDPHRVLAEAAHAELDGETLLAFVGSRVAAMPPEGHAPAP